MFDKVCGSDKVRLEFTKRWMVEDIKELWNKDIKKYKKKASKYYIYK